MPRSCISDVPHVSRELAQSARDHYQHLYADPLTEEDGREIATNLIGAFKVLQEWQERAARTEPPAAVTEPPRDATTKRKKVSKAEPGGR